MFKEKELGPTLPGILKYEDSQWAMLIWPKWRRNVGKIGHEESGLAFTPHFVPIFPFPWVLCMLGYPSVPTGPNGVFRRELRVLAIKRLWACRRGGRDAPFS